MRAEALERLVDKPVKDTYGRYVGFVVGFSVDTSGELRSIGVDQGNGDFTEYPNHRVVTTAEGFTLIPEWKVSCDSLGKEIEAVKKRAKALQDLAREGEITRVLFDEMMSKYNDEASKIQGDYKSLTEGMVVRMGELEGQKESLDRFLANIKVQFRAGEIDEAAFKVAAESCQSMLKRNSQEMEDISRMLKAATGPISQPQHQERLEPQEHQQEDEQQVAEPPVQQAAPNQSE